MKKFLLFLAIGAVVITLLYFGMDYLRLKQTKKLSPEDFVVYHQDDLTMSVFYNRPYKKGREIFGKLVPYGKVWRTGANEATTIEVNKDIMVDGHLLKAGKYSLWTIPGAERWTIIFNSEHGQWGVNADGESNRNPVNDVLTIDVMAVTQQREFEQFTISFEKTGEDAEMVLIWDKTVVAVPFSY